MIDAARLGMWLLLGVTLAIQGGFVAFFLYLRRQAAQGPAPGARRRVVPACSARRTGRGGTSSP